MACALAHLLSWTSLSSVLWCGPDSVVDQYMLLKPTKSALTFSQQSDRTWHEIRSYGKIYLVYVKTLYQKLTICQDEEGGHFLPLRTRALFMHVQTKYADTHIMHKPSTRTNTEVYPVETILDRKAAAVDDLWWPRRFLEQMRHPVSAIQNHNRCEDYSS